MERFGRIDALVNVAGAVPGLDLFQMTDEQWDAGLQLKFHGARRLTIAAWDALKASKGAVVFTSGMPLSFPRLARLRSARSTPRSRPWPRHLPSAASTTVSR